MRKLNVSISRRRFLASTALTTAGYFLPRRSLTAPEESPVTVIRTAAATVKITIQKLRGNVSMLEGSLTGNDGKLLVDAGITASRPAITDALARIGPDPVKHLINTHWHFVKKQGKPLGEIIEARPNVDYDSKWGQFVIDGKTFTSLVYRGV